MLRALCASRRTLAIVLAIGLFSAIAPFASAQVSPVEIKDVKETQFRAADTNGDGFLSMEEFLEARNIDFDAADTNKDGWLSRQEVESASK